MVTNEALQRQIKLFTAKLSSQYPSLNAGIIAEKIINDMDNSEAEYFLKTYNVRDWAIVRFNFQGGKWYWNLYNLYTGNLIYQGNSTLWQRGDQSKEFERVKIFQDAINSEIVRDTGYMPVSQSKILNMFSFLTKVRDEPLLYEIKTGTTVIEPGQGSNPIDVQKLIENNQKKQSVLSPKTDTIPPSTNIANDFSLSGDTMLIIGLLALGYMMLND